jgi:hypothetical protein
MPWEYGKISGAISVKTTARPAAMAKTANPAERSILRIQLGLAPESSGNLTAKAGPMPDNRLTENTLAAITNKKAGFRSLRASRANTGTGLGR